MGAAARKALVANLLDGGVAPEAAPDGVGGPT